MLDEILSSCGAHEWDKPVSDVIERPPNRRVSSGQQYVICGWIWMNDVIASTHYTLIRFQPHSQIDRQRIVGKKKKINRNIYTNKLTVNEPLTTTTYCCWQYADYLPSVCCGCWDEVTPTSPATWGWEPAPAPPPAVVAAEVYIEVFSSFFNRLCLSESPISMCCCCCSFVLL